MAYKPGRRRAFTCLRCSNLFFWNLQFETQWIGESISKIRHSDEQMQVHDFRIGEVLLQSSPIGICDLRRSSRQLFRISERGLGFFANPCVVSLFLRVLLLSRQAGWL